MKFLEFFKRLTEAQLLILGLNVALLVIVIYLTIRVDRITPRTYPGYTPVHALYRMNGTTNLYILAGQDE